MIRPALSELHDLATSICDTADFLGDVIDGDTYGDIENKNAKTRLNALRALFKAHGVAILFYVTKLESEAQDA